MSSQPRHKVRLLSPLCPDPVDDGVIQGARLNYPACKDSARRSVRVQRCASALQAGLLCKVLPDRM